MITAGCAATSPYTTEPFDARFQQDDDRRPIPQPRETVFSGRWDRVEGRVVRPIYDAIDVPAKIREAVGKPKEAENVNAWDEVPDSSWFTNRIGRRRPTRDELLRRAARKPDTSGPWTVIAGKQNGASVGFTALDASGEMFFIKFDPPGYEGLVTGAEIVSTLIMHAAGYNVPENHLLVVEPTQFVLGEGAETPGKYGVDRAMTQADLERLLAKVELRADGTARILASRALPGKPVGPCVLSGTRPDDPNDRIPHQHRRELRAAHVLFAWLNNPDMRVMNTLDTYVGEPGAGYVQHNLLDFGTSLGSRGFGGHKAPSDGYELMVDFEASLKNAGTMGFHEAYWESNRSSGFVSVGLFEHENFDPLRWAPWWPNPAWKALTARDGLWASRIMIEFSDADLAAIVAEAQLPEPGAAEYLTRELIERRNKVAAVYFGLLAPLDEFEIVRDARSGEPALRFEDLAVTHGLATLEARELTYSVASDPGDEHTRRTVARIEAGRYRVPLSLPGDRAGEDLRVELELRDAGTPIGGGVAVYVHCWSETECLVTGIERRY